MLIGILSDTHDNLAAAAAGMAVLRGAGAEFFIHCGDVGSEQILDLLAGAKSMFVWGNNDYDRAELARYAADLEIKCGDNYGEVEIDGKKIVVTHGDEPRMLARAMAPQACDYLLMGHTHVPRDERVGGLRIINPGALHRAARKTVAVLDPRRDLLRLLTVPEPR
ncbi:MAG: YfcE family phosphodiesterase [Planctomycetota bacterium]|nr:YfcE family phosphodiesterase [Planctomycetota bacterium]